MFPVADGARGQSSTNYDSTFADLMKRLANPPPSEEQGKRLAAVCLDAARRAQHVATDVTDYLEVCKQARRVARGVKDYRTALSLGRFEASYLLDDGDADAAEHVLRRLVVQYRKSTPVAQVYLQLADLLRGGGDWEQAVDALDGAVSELNRWRDRLRADAVAVVEATILSERFRLAMSLGWVERAGSWLVEQRAAIDRARRPDAATVDAYARNLVRWLVATRRLREAAAELARRFPGSSGAGEPRAMPAEITLQRAMLAFFRGERDAALSAAGGRETPAAAGRSASLDQLESELSAELPVDLAVEPLLELAWRQIGRGDLEAAAATHKRADAILRGLRSRVSYPEASLRAAWLDATESRLLRARREQGIDTTKPHEVRRLLDRLRTRCDDFLHGWTTKGGSLEDSSFLDHPDRRRLVGELVALTLLVEPPSDGVERAFREVLRVQALGRLDRSIARRAGVSFEAGSVPLDALRAGLLDDEGIVVYLFAPDSGHAFLLDRARLEHVALDAEGESVRALRRQVCVSVADTGTAPRVDRDRLGGALGVSKILERMREGDGTDHRAWKRVTVVGDRQLGWLPVSSVLPEDVPVSHLPSLSVGVQLRDRRPQGAMLRAMFVSGLKDHHSEVWGREYTTKWSADLAGELLGSSQVLHVTAEVLPAGVDGKGAAIDLLPRDVRGADIARLEKVPPYVVLTLCSASAESDKGATLETGVGLSVDEDEARLALAEAFLEAGACAVVLAPVTVERVPALVFSSVLHRELVQGRGPSEAIVTARREAAGVGGRAPSLRHAFRVVGHGHRP